MEKLLRSKKIAKKENQLSVSLSPSLLQEWDLVVKADHPSELIKFR